jgi:hypothetical protein
MTDDTPPKPKRRRWRWLAVGLLLLVLAVTFDWFRPRWDARAVGLWLEGTRPLQIRENGQGAFLTRAPNGFTVSQPFRWWTKGDRLFIDSVGDGRRTELQQLLLMVSGQSAQRIYRIADSQLVPEDSSATTLTRYHE